MIETPALNFNVIAPTLALVISAVVVLLADLFLSSSRKHVLAYLAGLGVVAAFFVNGMQWRAAGTAFVGAAGMAVADGYALFFNYVFLTVAGLAVLISADYTDREGLAQGEYYGLLLLSTAGMTVMAAATDLMVLFVGLEILSIPLYVLAGLKPDGTVLINTERAASDLKLKTSARVVTFPATQIALEELGRPIMNTAIMGAFSGVSGAISFEAIEQSIRHRFPEELGEKNVRAARRAYELIKEQAQ